MPRASNIEPTVNISMLFKSPFGFGKTIAAASFAIFGPVWIAYFDKRVPIEIFTYFKKIGREDLLERIEYDVYSSGNAHEYLNKLISFVSNGCPYVAIATDSVTNLTSAAVGWSLGFRDPRGGKRDKLNKDAPQMIPDFDEYKVETSLAMQALDICKTLPVFNIWTAHPLPALDMKGSGNTMTVSKVTHIVSYGQKVGAIVPGSFNEIYHFGRRTDYSTTPPTSKRIVYTDMIGDDYAKTCYSLPKEFDITDKLFAEVWKDLIDKSFIDKVVNPKGTGGSNVIDMKSKGGTDWIPSWKK